MSFRTKIKHYLIHALNYTNKTAGELISSGKLTVNGIVIKGNEILLETDSLELNGCTIKKGVKYSYYALYKPIGIESTFDSKREDNLSKIFPFGSNYFIAGRLDKASEGLLLISNDGKWVNDITNNEAYKEKEYIVEVDKQIDANFIEKISNGLDIGICITRPCKAQQINAISFSIILTEGKNRQIRRMCLALGFYVMRLQRTRIDEFYLSDLKPVEFKELILT